MERDADGAELDELIGEEERAISKKYGVDEPRRRAVTGTEAIGDASESVDADEDNAEDRELNGMDLMGEEEFVDRLGDDTSSVWDTEETDNRDDEQDSDGYGDEADSSDVSSRSAAFAGKKRKKLDRIDNRVEGFVEIFGGRYSGKDKDIELRDVLLSLDMITYSKNKLNKLNKMRKILG